MGVQLRQGNVCRTHQIGVSVLRLNGGQFVAVLVKHLPYLPISCFVPISISTFAQQSSQIKHLCQNAVKQNLDEPIVTMQKFLPLPLHSGRITLGFQIHHPVHILDQQVVIHDPHGAVKFLFIHALKRCLCSVSRLRNASLVKCRQYQIRDSASGSSHQKSIHSL